MNKLSRLVEQHFTGTYLCSLRVRCTILLFLPKSDIFQIHCCCFCTVIWNLLWESKKGNLIQRNGVVVSNSAKDFMPHPNLQETSEVHWYMLHHNNSDSQKSDFGLERRRVFWSWSWTPVVMCGHFFPAPPAPRIGVAKQQSLGCTWLRTSCLQVFICWGVIPVRSFSRLFSSHRGSQSGKGALTSPDCKAL